MNHEFASLNGQILPTAAAMIPAVSSAALYGKGIFTTIAVYNGIPFLWEKHWQRLRSNAVTLDIDLSDFSEESLKNSLVEILKKNGATKARARLTIFDEKPGGLWPFESIVKTKVLIATANTREVPADLRLTLSPYIINPASPLAGIKSCNYLEKILALDDAKKRGFGEAICLNKRGEIASGCMANVFWLSEEKLYTPSLKTGCLAGTTREYLMENAECFEVEEGLESLRNADAVFLTSAGLGIVQPVEFDGMGLTARQHEILSLVPL